MLKKQQKNKAKTKAKSKKDLKEAFSSYKEKILKVKVNTWYFSVFFFVVIFLVSIWVWWVGFYDAKPSQEVVTKFESSKENFEAMKSGTETAIELLKDRQEKVRNIPDFSGQRDLFVDRRELELYKTQKANEDVKAEGDLLQEPPENADTFQ